MKSRVAPKVLCLRRGEEGGDMTSGSGETCSRPSTYPCLSPPAKLHQTRKPVAQGRVQFKTNRPRQTVKSKIHLIRKNQAGILMLTVWRCSGKKFICRSSVSGSIENCMSMYSDRRCPALLHEPHGVTGSHSNQGKAEQQQQNGRNQNNEVVMQREQCCRI